MPKPANTPERRFKGVRQLEVTVWKNEKSFSVTLSGGRFKDQAGEWQTSKSFFREELPSLIHCLTLALNWTDAQSLVLVNELGIDFEQLP